MPANVSEIGREDWIDASDTQARSQALRALLAAICVISACLLVFHSLTVSLNAPVDFYDVALLPAL
jgi:hypothetical protein